MTLASRNRFTTVFSTFQNVTKASALLLTGTRLETAELYENSSQDGYFIYNFGIAPRSKSHAGVAIALDEKAYPRHHVSDVWAPIDLLTRGRWGAVRVKGNNFDIVFLAIYLPPSFAEKQNKHIFNSTLKEVSEFLSRLPSRSVPIVGGDFNARLGIQKNLDGTWSPTQSLPVGSHARERETPAGAEVRKFLDMHKLAALNSHFNAGATYFSPSSPWESSIDFLLGPWELIESCRVKWSRVFRKEGDMLQSIRCRHRADHRPSSLCSTSLSTL